MSDAGLPAHFVRGIPPGDVLERDICSTCGHVHYRNPKIVVGSIVRHQSRILLCRRAIDPRSGFWTLPAGYLELGETSEQGALREAREEASATIAIDRLFAVYSIPRIAQVQVMYLAHLLSPEIAPGPESIEAALFDWGEIPWNELAFPSVRWALEQYRSVEGSETFLPFANPPGERGDMR